MWIIFRYLSEYMRNMLYYVRRRTPAKPDKHSVCVVSDGVGDACSGLCIAAYSDAKNSG